MSDLSQSPDQFLTFEEVAEVDRALMNAREKFSARVALYSLRSLKQIAQQSGATIADLKAQQIADWVADDPTLNTGTEVNDAEADDRFKQFFAQMVISSIKPLNQIALETEGAIENLTVSQVVAWFEKESKIRMEQGNEATFLG
jgi:hypothetical protein